MEKREKMKKRNKDKTCFLVTPIGDAGTPIRRRVDQWMKLVYEPVLEDSHNIVRADEIAPPGYITRQVLEHVTQADLAIIDFTNFNPNVIYEAAIRHAAVKPWIHIHAKDKKFPFDIQDMRSIEYDPTVLTYTEKLRKDLEKVVKVVIAKGYKTPEIMTHRFDFNKIIEDPKKFVELMKQHLTPIMDAESGTISIAPPYSSLASISPSPSPSPSPPPFTTTSPPTVMCPSCGSYNTRRGDLTTHLYICNECGTAF